MCERINRPLVQPPTCSASSTCCLAVSERFSLNGILGYNFFLFRNKYILILSLSLSCVSIFNSSFVQPSLCSSSFRRVFLRRWNSAGVSAGHFAAISRGSSVRPVLSLCAFEATGTTRQQKEKRKKGPRKKGQQSPRSNVSSCSSSFVAAVEPVIRTTRTSSTSPLLSKIT